MNRIIAIGITGCLLAGAVSFSAAFAQEAHRIDVTLREWELEASEQAPAGTVEFVVTNEGGLVHNFKIEGMGIEESFPDILRSGETRVLQVELVPGNYELSCPIGNHAEMGERQELEVVETGRLD